MKRTQKHRLPWGGLAGVMFVVLCSRLPDAGVASAGASGPLVDIAPQLRPLIEADWGAQDQQFRAVRGVKEPFSLEHIRHIIGRAEGLADRLRLDLKADSSLERRLHSLAEKLRGLQRRIEQMASHPPAPNERLRRETYLAARGLLRQIAFCNPRLQFDRLLFVKRHDAGGPFHMCDQFYGCNARPGGGLFVLHDPFGERPRLQNLLQNAVVERGRLAGRRLQGGSFLSPELSFDARTILFAYSEAKAKATYQWAPEYCYHVFRVEADGRHLQQLTDGPWDDFDPCFLPNGRVVFVTTRRGGYLRCGRHCPVYTMFTMAADGSDIRPLSFHETHEWQPSVNHQGMLVYTRWDYVDRDTNVAHHIWTCFPDGSDPRSYHGNYPLRRESRPWMEMSIRAVPGSSKYVAVTGAHHGHAFGSLVLIDLEREDDRAASQLERLTPEVPFPEAEGRPIARYMVYGTPWPLSEDDYLCACDPQAKNHGIYWIDRFGNRELIYRDPQIACLDPIPLHPRPRPPVLPERPATPITRAWSPASKVAGKRVERQRAEQMGHSAFECCAQSTAVSHLEANGPAGDAERTGTGLVAVMSVYLPGRRTRKSRRCASSNCYPRPLRRPTSRASAWPTRPTPGPFWARCRWKQTAAPISRCRPARPSISRRSTKRGWPCSRCVRSPMCMPASDCFARVATNASGTPRRQVSCRWRCDAHLRESSRTWKARTRSTMHAWSSRSGTGTVWGVTSSTAHWT